MRYWPMTGSTPHLAKQDPDALPPGERVIDADIARSVLQVLDRVTGPGGTATLARVPGFLSVARLARFTK